MELPGRKHIDDGAHASAALFNAMAPGVDRELSNRDSEWMANNMGRLSAREYRAAARAPAGR
jgi:hypothetical protein